MASRTLQTSYVDPRVGGSSLRHSQPNPPTTGRRPPRPRATAPRRAMRRPRRFSSGSPSTRPHIRLSSYGTSPQGRRMPLVIVSRDGAFTPGAGAAEWQADRADPKRHPQRRDRRQGRLSRPAARPRDRPPERLRGRHDSARHPDLQRRRSRASVALQPRQSGRPGGGDGLPHHHPPATISTAITSRSKRSRPRALIDLVNRWRPHFHVDNHVTNGSDHDWVFTWSWGEAPQLSPTLDAWMGAPHALRVGGH